MFTCVLPFANIHGLFFELRCTRKYCSEQEWRINWAPDIILKNVSSSSRIGRLMYTTKHLKPVELSPNHAMLPSY